MHKIAVVTGGSAGIGHHLVGALANAGFQVAFTYRSSSEPAYALVDNLQQAGFKVAATTVMLVMKLTSLNFMHRLSKTLVARPIFW